MWVLKPMHIGVTGPVRTRGGEGACGERLDAAAGGKTNGAEGGEEKASI
jgi:hypothetical protein